jgi:lipoic acid synthetase
LPDGGAEVFARTIREIRRISPGTTVEVLIPDFLGSSDALAIVAAAAPEVLNHNMETVQRLYSVVRPQADYQRSLQVLAFAREHSSMVVKSGIMVGLGETTDELMELFADVAAAGCQVLTIGQYLRPTSQHHPVHRYVTPEEFDQLRHQALAAGLNTVVAGPLVRSSYRAATVYGEVARRGCSVRAEYE